MYHCEALAYLGPSPRLLMEKEMATHSSILVQKTPWTEEPGGLQAMGSQKSGTRLSSKQQQPHLCEWYIMAENEDKQEPLGEVKEESERVGLRRNIK